MAPEPLRAEIARARTLTGRPFGINIIIAEDPTADPEDDRQFIRDQIEVAIEQGVAAVVLFWGDPAPYLAAPQAKACEC